MRRLRIAAPAQIPLALAGLDNPPADRWAALPEGARQQVLVLLARLIAKGVLDVGGDDDG